MGLQSNRKLAKSHISDAIPKLLINDQSDAEYLKRGCIGRLLVLLVGRHHEFSKDER